MQLNFVAKWPRNKSLVLGRAIAQAVSRWLTTTAARVRARVWSCGIFGGQSGARAFFLRVLRFPLPIFVPPITPQSPSSVIWGLYNRPVVAVVPSGHSLTAVRIKKVICHTENDFQNAVVSRTFYQWPLWPPKIVSEHETNAKSQGYGLNRGSALCAVRPT
jgi:hypothetical protein